MFTQPEIKAFLLTQGFTVKSIKALQIGGDVLNSFNPKVIYYGHTQGLVEKPQLGPGNIKLYMDNSGSSPLGDEKEPGQPPILETKDFFFRYLELQNATALFNGYKIEIV